MFTKLKLEIKVGLIRGIDDDGNLVEKFPLKITVIDKDERFDAGQKVGTVLMYNNSKYNFRIKSLWDEKWGGIIHNGLMLPSMDRIGVEYTKDFDTDEERYNYLKCLYLTMDEWANYWWGFSYDSNSNMEVNDNIWEISCDTVYLDTTNILESDVSNDLPF
jgi:hypothetical protein